MSEKLFRFPFTSAEPILPRAGYSILYGSVAGATDGTDVFGDAFWDDSDTPAASSGGDTFNRRFPFRRTIR